jgi:hypothetical protein
MKIDLYKFFVIIIVSVIFSSCAYYPVPPDSDHYPPPDQPPVYTKTWSEFTKGPDGVTTATYTNISEGYVSEPPKPEEIANAVSKMEGRGQPPEKSTYSSETERPSRRHKNTQRNYVRRQNDQKQTPYKHGEEMVVEIINQTPFEFYALEIEREDGSVKIVGRLRVGQSKNISLRMGERIKIYSERMEVEGKIGKSKSKEFVVDSNTITIIH